MLHSSLNITAQSVGKDERETEKVQRDHTGRAESDERLKVRLRET